jgi:hypothetical protein
MPLTEHLRRYLAAAGCALHTHHLLAFGMLVRLHFEARSPHHRHGEHKRAGALVTSHSLT